MKRLAFFLLLTLLPAATQAHEIKVGSLVIVHPMVNEAEKGQAETRGSMEIRNEGSVPDHLLSIRSEFADEVTIDGSPPIAVPAKGRASVLLQFKNIKRKLSEDEAYAGELVFEKAGVIKVDMMVHAHSH